MRTLILEPGKTETHVMQWWPTGKLVICDDLEGTPPAYRALGQMADRVRVWVNCYCKVLQERDVLMKEFASFQAKKKKMRENSDLWDSERKKRLFPDPSEQAIRVETGFERQKPSKLSQLKTVAQACGKDQIKGIAFCSWQLIRISFVPPM